MCKSVPLVASSSAFSLHQSSALTCDMRFLQAVQPNVFQPQSFLNSFERLTDLLPVIYIWFFCPTSPLSRPCTTPKLSLRFVNGSTACSGVFREAKKIHIFNTYVSTFTLHWRCTVFSTLKFLLFVRNSVALYRTQWPHPSLVPPSMIRRLPPCLTNLSCTFLLRRACCDYTIILVRVWSLHS